MKQTDNFGFKRFGVMLDCSRNAVMKVDTVKRFVDIVSKLGYNELQLYTEDTYTITEYASFGYGRGRYSKEELREIDKDCIEKGVELVPCVQTLAHLKQIFRHQDFSNLCDIDSVLNCMMDKTYELIELMIKNISDCFSSKRINLGMDEANLGGHGIVFFKNGQVPSKDEYMLNHVEKVKSIADKYGYECSVWYDQFAWAAFGDNFYNESNLKSKGFVEKFPKDINLIYWDYGGWLKDGCDQSEYINRINCYRNITPKVHFAGSVERQSDFFTNPEYNNKVLEAQLYACKKAKVDSFLITIWGDDGVESPWFIGLPSLYYASTIVYPKEFCKKEFLSLTGFDYYIIDELSKINYSEQDGKLRYIKGLLKTILYDDILQMNYIHFIGEDTECKINNAIQKLDKLNYNSNYVYFKALSVLCKFAKIKIEYSKNVYKEYDDRKMDKSIELLTEMNVLLKQFEQLYRKQWYIDNKSFGYEIFCIKIGGLIQRNNVAIELLLDYQNGKIKNIEELDNRNKIKHGFGASYKDLVTFNIF